MCGFTWTPYRPNVIAGLSKAVTEGFVTALVRKPFTCSSIYDCPNREDLCAECQRIICIRSKEATGNGGVVLFTRGQPKGVRDAVLCPKPFNHKYKISIWKLDDEP